MTTLTETRPPKTDEGLVPYRLTVRQFDQMIGAGVFPDDVRVELLGGILARKMTKYPPHDFCVSRLGNRFRQLVAPSLVIREEKAVILGENWRPEPDLAVAQGPDDRYRAVQPTAKELLLLVEVSESSYPADRGIKWHGYAAAGVPAYLIVNLAKRTVEVYDDPIGLGESASYRGTKIYGEGDAIPVVIEGQELGTVAVNDILP